MTDIAGAQRNGMLPNLDAVVAVKEGTITAGPARGSRAIDVTVWDGIDLRILPDRGFDLGQAWYEGKPLAWVSEVGEAPPRTRLEGMDWTKAFGGGLLTTCGLRNVGTPSEGHGLHGSYSHLAAAPVEVARFAADGGAGATARAVIDDETEYSHFRLERTITTWAGRGRVEITDTTLNLGSAPEPAPLLYHFNFGFPLWGPGASLAISATATHARDEASTASLDNWPEPPAVQEGPERVLEHQVESNDGWGEARLTNRTVGAAVMVRWELAELPRLHQWVHPAPGMYVLGIEPANCSTQGRGFDRAEGRLPMLFPEAPRVTRLAVVAEPA